MTTSIADLYQKIRNPLYEDKKSPVNIIILTNERENHDDEDKKLFQTARRFQEECDKKLCKAAIRTMMDTGRCVYTYFSGSFIELPRVEGAAEDAPQD